VHDNKPYVLALESKSKTKEGNIGKSILSLKRSFRRVINALRRVNFLFDFNKLSFTIFTFRKEKKKTNTKDKKGKKIKIK
jgi:hypothetical protein